MQYVVGQVRLFVYDFIEALMIHLVIHPWCIDVIVGFWRVFGNEWNR